MVCLRPWLWPEVFVCCWSACLAWSISQAFWPSVFLSRFSWPRVPGQRQAARKWPRRQGSLVVSIDSPERVGYGQCEKNGSNVCRMFYA